MNTLLWFIASDMKTHNYNTKKKILRVLLPAIIMEGSAKFSFNFSTTSDAIFFHSGV